MITFKASKNLTVEILDSCPPSTPEEDFKRLTQYVYYINELGKKQEKKKSNLT